MKPIRYLAVILLLLTGIVHLILGFMAPGRSEAVLMILFGVAYFVAGLTLLLKPAAGTIMGMIFPLTGLLIGIFKIGPASWNALFCILFAVDAIILISCFYIRFPQHKGT